MHPWRREPLVKESPTEPHGAVETAVLVEGKMRLGVRFQPAPELGVIAVAQVLTQNLLAAAWMADAERALNEQTGCNLERPASLVELLCLLWWSQVCKPALAGLEV